MIDKLTYDQVLTFAKELRAQAGVVEEVAKAREVQDLVDFADTVMAYAKFLENTVELNRDADKAIADMTGLTGKK